MPVWAVEQIPADEGSLDRAGLTDPANVGGGMVDAQALAGVLNQLGVDLGITSNQAVRELLQRIAPGSSGSGERQFNQAAWKPGDMGVRPGLDKLPPVAVVTTPGDAVAGESAREMRTAAMTLAESNGWVAPDRRFANDDTGWNIRLTKDSLKHGFSNRGLHNIRLVAAMPDLIRHAVLAETMPHDPPSGRFKQVHRLFGAVELDGQLYRVKLTVKERVGAEGMTLYDHVGTEITKPDGISQRATPEAMAVAGPASGFKISIGSLLAEVKDDQGRPYLTDADPSILHQAMSGDDPDSDHVVFANAKKLFGTTQNIKETGYILPDGSMLDMSGRHAATGYKDGKPLPGQSDYLQGGRNIDHREINEVMPADEEDADGTRAMLTFMGMGAIRIDVIRIANNPQAR